MQPTSDLHVEVLAEELDRLIHTPSAFDRPETLFSRLEVLLRLTSVRKAASPKEDSRPQLVMALREVLVEVIDQLIDPQAREAARILFFLDRADGIHDSKLGGREQEIEDRLEWKSFRRERRHQLVAFVAGELMAYEIESRGNAQYGPRTGSRGQDSEPHSPRATFDTISNALRRQYPRAPDVYPLATLLIADRPHYQDVVVDLRLADSPDSPEHYVWDLTLSFSASIDEYVVALVSKPGLCDLVLTECPRVTDVYSCSTEAEQRALGERLAESIDAITLLERREGGQTRHRGLRLRHLTDEEAAPYLDELEAGSEPAATVLRAEFPDRQTSDPPRLRARQRFELEKSDRFCHWFADRPTYVNRIQIDFSEFTPNDRDRGDRLTIQPFMMAGASEAALTSESPVTMPIENWLVRGQGFAVIW